MANTIDPALLAFAGLYEQAQPAMAVIWEKARRAGEDMSTRVFVVGDPSEPNTRLMLRDLGRVEDDESAWVALVPTERVARILRKCRADSFATLAEGPIAPGRMRLCLLRGGKVLVHDVRSLAPLAPGGTA